MLILEPAGNRVIKARVRLVSKTYIYLSLN
jgi:hypothetical protein